MLDNKVQDVITLPPGAGQSDCKVLLDANAVKGFLDWLDVNADFERQLRVDRVFHIGVLRRHVETRADWKSSKGKRDGIRHRLEDHQIELLGYTLGRGDEYLTDEMQRAYFGSDPTDRKSAELLAYGRTNTHNGGPVRIISLHRGFRVVPRVELYVLNLDEVGIDSEAAYLRLFNALDVHPKVFNSAFRRIENGDYPVAVSETAKQLIHEIRQIGVAHNMSFTAEKNDQPMVDKALRTYEPDPKNKATKVTPHIQLNSLTSPSEESEQRGYHDIAIGIVSALRNPTAHTPADEAFLRERFGDRRTALKVLCLLSLLFEKLDARVAPR